MSNDYKDTDLPYHCEHRRSTPSPKHSYSNETSYGLEYGRNGLMHTFSPAHASGDIFDFFGLFCAGLIALGFVGFFGGLALSMALILISSVLGLHFDPFENPLSLLLLAFASLCLIGALMHWTDHDRTVDKTRTLT